MSAFLAALDTAVRVAQVAFLVGAFAVGLLCVVEWAVRTRRLNPFSAVARQSRRIMAPIVGRVERRVIRAGGTPASAPWWTLAAIVVAGILVLSALEVIRGQAFDIYAAASAGARGVLRLMVRWGFFVFYIALLVRVVSSWFRLNPFGRITRWSTVLTEWMLRPVRRVLPAFGMVDLSPLVAYLALRIVESLVLRYL